MNLVQYMIFLTLHFVPWIQTAPSPLELLNVNLNVKNTESEQTVPIQFQGSDNGLKSKSVSEKINSNANDYYYTNKYKVTEMKSSVVQEVEASNAQYATEFGSKGSIPMPPGRKFTILTCMDARLDPAKFAGLVEGDAHVIRNAGGRATDDAIRSLVVSYKLLGTREWFVIHHTDCGMLTFNDTVMGDLLASSLKPSSNDGSGWRDHEGQKGTQEGKFIKWLPISDLEDSVVTDVQRIRQNPMVPHDIPIYGYIYSVSTGQLLEIPKATEMGRIK